MKEYGELLADDPAWAERARAFQRARADVSELLAELGEPRAPRHADSGAAWRTTTPATSRTRRASAAQPRDAAALDSRHRARRAGRAGDLLRQRRHLQPRQPDAAGELGGAKARNIAALQPDIIATGNPGCTLQIAAAAGQAGLRLAGRSSDRARLMRRFVEPIPDLGQGGGVAGEIAPNIT